MPFQKKNKFGNRFTKDNQPSPEAKSHGWAEKKLMKDDLKMVLSSKLVDDRAKQAVKQLLPKIKQEDITIQLTAMVKLASEALKGNTAAFQTIMKILGEGQENIAVQQVESFEDCLVQTSLLADELDAEIDSNEKS